MDTRTTIKTLGSRAEVDMAMDLLADQIPDVLRSHIGYDGERTTRACATFLRRVVAPTIGADDAVMIPHIWIGAYDGDELVGATHASAQTDVAASHIRMHGHGNEGAGTLPWIHRLLNVAASIEEIAVMPSSRGRGVGHSLLNAVHSRLREHQLPGSWDDNDRTVRTWASTSAHPLFKSAGYSIAAPREVPPPEYVGGAPMLRDAQYDDRDGAYCYGFLSDLS